MQIAFKWSQWSRWSLFIATFLLAFSTASAFASSPARPLSETAKVVNEGIKSSWSCSKKLTDKYTEITFGLADTGKIYEPVVTSFSDDDQFDAECMEAICSMSPIAPPPKFHSAFLDRYQFRFGVRSDLKPRFEGTDVNRYLITHPQPKEISYALDQTPFVLIHRIPLTVLTRYPGMFAESELVTTNNLLKVSVYNTSGKCIKIQPVHLHRIADFYAGWNEIFKQPNVTKAQILEWANITPPVL